VVSTRTTFIGCHTDIGSSDPIDPEFHSPNKTPPSSNDSALPSTVSQNVLAPPVPVVEAKEVEEDSRRRTIAERMAKLGGIKFGAPPPIGRPPHSASRVETFSPEEPGTPVLEEDSSEIPITEGEEEQARRQRIASKLAGMGGIGMFGAPHRTPPPLPHVRRQSSEETPAPISSSAPQRAVPPPRPPPPPQQPDTDSELESHSTSEDGVKVEAEDSEPEEVQHEDAVEPEAPPPVPSRAGRRTSTLVSFVESTASPPRQPTQSPPPLPGGRPPIPSVPINRKSSLRKSSADYVPSSTRMGSFDTSRASPLSATPPSGYVMVDEPENTLLDEAPPRPSRGPPSRPAPPPTKEGVSEWEMPSIPTSFDGPQLDLSLSSWSEDSTSFPGPPAPAPPAFSSAQQESKQPPAQAPPKLPTDVQLSSDELMAVWGRVGVQICETATTLFEKSKKLVVGDGSYYGFVSTVFSQVPNAMPPSSSGYGYLIYSQSGSAVSRRVSDILPGDIVELYDAKLKGHKGLQSYHQEVGAGEPLVGVVNEFEAKKSKIKVFHANQHVGQQVYICVLSLFSC
jgi:myosin tail region-interacting protein MTI1